MMGKMGKCQCLCVEGGLLESIGVNEGQMCRW